MLKDCTGKELTIGDRVGVAFQGAYSSGRIRVGTLVSLEPFVVTWDNGDASKPMAYRPQRVVIL